MAKFFWAGPCRSSMKHRFPLVRLSVLLASPCSSGSLMADDLADQVELIKIIPQSLSSEEVSKLWTAFQASIVHRRIHVSVVLIESTDPVKTPCLC